MFSIIIEHDGSTAHYLLKKFFDGNNFQLSLIIVGFFAVDSDSYQYIKKLWDLSLKKYCNPITLAILGECNADQ